LKSAGSKVAWDTTPATKAADETAYFILSIGKAGSIYEQGLRKELPECDTKVLGTGRTLLIYRKESVMMVVATQ